MESIPTKRLITIQKAKREKQEKAPEEVPQ
jgi:hypothetical protein